ncbi:hypothetical protein NPIL_253211 [Nephila pilipes]|uniref:Uncharacterized protein n=1 Tax=Nephila pilipes TaxID=299642 RepID=A0A8X6N563_NEPPI|nr:hypothetical protein NPIL_253211 [Nephila pilipes]
MYLVILHGPSLPLPTTCYLPIVPIAYGQYALVVGPLIGFVCKEIGSSNSEKHNNSSTPIALRTLLPIVLMKVLQLGQCKLTPATFSTHKGLGIHVFRPRSPNAKRKENDPAIGISCGLPKRLLPRSQPDFVSASNQR